MKKNKVLVAALAIVALTATGFAAWQVSGGFKNAEKTIDLDPSIETHVDSKVCLNDIEVKGLASNPTELKFDTSKNTVFTYKYNVKGLNTANDQNPYDYYGDKALVIDKTDDMPYLKMSVKYIDKSVAGGVAASDQLVADFNKYFTLNLPEADREVSYTTWLASEYKETGYNTQGLSFSWSNYFGGKTPEEFLKTKSIQENENTLAELEAIISKIKFQLVFKVEAPTTPVAKEYSGVITLNEQQHSTLTIEGLTQDKKVEVGNHLITLTIDDGYELDGDFKINGEVVTLVEGKYNYPFAKDTAYTISYAVKQTQVVPPTGGDGSYGNPYTVDEVLQLNEVINLANNAYLDHNVYIKGTIELTNDSYTSVYNEQKQYNKINLKGTSGTLYIYRIYYEDSTLFHNGDEVQIDAALQKYNDKPQVTCNGSDHVSSVALLTHKMHTVQVADGIQNGTVNLDNKFASVACGTEVSFTVTPAEGYKVESVKVNNKSVSAEEGVYKFVVEADSYISATFADATQPSQDKFYNKVTSVDKLVSGKYLVAAEVDSTVLAFNGIDAGKNKVVATPEENGSIKKVDDLAAVEMTVTVDNTDGTKISVLTPAGKYISSKSGDNNGLVLSESEVKCDISLETGGWKIVHDTKIFVYNSTSGDTNERFRFYKAKTVADKPTVYLFVSLYLLAE